jgi:tRNA 2-thiouridine synthesizing protein E
VTIEGPHGPVELDDRGYLRDGSAWTPELAAVLAARDGLRSLSPDHWRIIEALRAHHAARGVLPPVRELCRATDLTLKRIYELFPKGPGQDACRVAGLPKPDGCV